MLIESAFSRVAHFLGNHSMRKIVALQHRYHPAGIAQIFATLADRCVRGLV
jgi:hypothetical protein